MAAACLFQLSTRHADGAAIPSLGGRSLNAIMATEPYWVAARAERMAAVLWADAAAANSGGAGAGGGGIAWAADAATALAASLPQSPGDGAPRSLARETDAPPDQPRLDLRPPGGPWVAVSAGDRRSGRGAEDGDSDGDSWAWGGSRSSLSSSGASTFSEAQLDELLAAGTNSNARGLAQSNSKKQAG